MDPSQWNVTDSTVPWGVTDLTVPWGVTDSTVPWGVTDSTLPWGVIASTVLSGVTDLTRPLAAHSVHELQEELTVGPWEVAALHTALAGGSDSAP